MRKSQIIHPSKILHLCILFSEIKTLRILILLFLFPIAHITVAQETRVPNRKCDTYESMQDYRRAHPGAETDEQFERWLSQKMINKSNFRDPLDLPYVIPVIFHIVHNGEPVGTGSNLDSDQINAQFNQLNQDFANLSGSEYLQSVDVEIEFCLALRSPSGFILDEPGINRINRNSQGWSPPPYNGIGSDSYVDETIMPESMWDPYTYFNVWTIDLSGSLLGKATFPTGSGLQGLSSGETDTHAGVFVEYQSVGSVSLPGPLGNEAGLGRTLTHEAGHYFGLRHIWGDDPDDDDNYCEETDYCNDIPPQNGPTSGCPEPGTLNGCDPSEPKMFENYLDYTNDNCVNTLTNNQKTRMQTVMVNSPRRVELATSIGCCILPDLIIINQSLNPINVLAGANITAFFAVDNNGSTSASPSYVRFYLSVDDVLTVGQNGDIYLDQHYVNQTLAPLSQTILLSESITIPSSVPTGTYYVFFWADGTEIINECDDENNFATAILNVTGVTQYPDLIIQNQSVSPTSILPGGQATVSCRNKNQGNATAGSSYTAIWLSENTVFDGAPTDINLNADILFPSLAPGQVSALLSAQITIPSGTECGTWYIMFGADALDQVDEGGGESNNQKFVPITVSCPLLCNNDYSCGPPAPPFLTIYTSCVETSCSTIGASPPSPDIPFYCFGNQYQSGRYDDDVWFRITPSSTDQLTITVVPTSNFSTFDPVIGLYQGACLTPTQISCADNGAEGVTENLVFTPTVGVEYRIRVFGYNIGYGSGDFDICVVTEGEPDPADLVVEDASLSDYTPCDGEDIDVTYTIVNIGGTDALTSTAKFYISTNSTFSAGDDLLGSQSTGSLDIGESVTKTKTLTIPSGTDEDDWYILIVVDANDNVDEGTNGENNNVHDISLYVVDCAGGVADLIISYQNHTPSTITPGTNVFVNYIAENIGNEDAAPCRIGIYISEDTDLDASDEYLDDWVQTSLDQGEVDNDDLVFEVPNCTPCGTYYIFLVIDYLHVIVESNNNNNDDDFEIDVTGCTSCTYYVPPTGIDFGSAGGSGSFSVTTTLCCPWTASTNDSWITLLTNNGIGTGTINYLVDPCSDGSTRAGTIYVAGQPHEISQSCVESCNTSQSFVWATRAGSATLSDAATDVAIDASGNLYMTGDIQGMADFGNGIILTTPSNAPDIFVSKHNSSGEIQWAIRFGNVDQEEGTGIETDSDGNIYVTGYFENSVEFGDFTLTSNGEDEYAAFILKLNTNGELDWAYKINAEFHGVSRDITINDGSIYVIGNLHGGPGYGLFIARYGFEGVQEEYDTYAWSTQIKYTDGVAVDNSGNLLICGRFSTTITLGGLTITADGISNIDGFIAKLNLDTDAAFWLNKLTSIGGGQDRLWSIGIDSLNNVYTVGEVDSSAIVDNFTIALSDGLKFIMIKYDSLGNAIWAKASPCGFQANKMRLIYGNDNTIYFSGAFQNCMQIDSFIITGSGGLDAFIARADANAKILWIRGFGGSNSDHAMGLALDTNNNVFVAGGFRSTVIFDDVVLTSAGSEDIFIAKYRQCDPPEGEISLEGDPVICAGESLILTTSFCSSNNYQWIFNGADISGANDPTYLATEPGIYSVRIFAYEGCESISEPVEILSQWAYTFIGNGNWNIASNWSNNTIPPEDIPDCYEIIIDHVPGGQCILYTADPFAPQVNVTVRPGKSFIVLPE